MDSESCRGCNTIRQQPRFISNRHIWRFNCLLPQFIQYQPLHCHAYCVTQ